MPPCLSCGTSDAPPAEVTRFGRLVAVGNVCDGCMEDTETLERMCEYEFEDMVSAGASESEALAVMSDRISGRRSAS